MSNNDTVDLNNTAQTLTEAGYDGKFKVHTNVNKNGMFNTIDVSSGTEKVIIKNTIIDMTNVTHKNGNGAFIKKFKLDDMNFDLIFENCVVINANLGNNSGGFIGQFDNSNSSTKDTGIIVFKNCYSHILSFGNSGNTKNGGFVSKYCPYKIYIYNCYVYNEDSNNKSSGFVVEPINQVRIYNSVSILTDLFSKAYTNKSNKQELSNCYSNLDYSSGSTRRADLLDENKNIDVEVFNEVANESIGQLITDDSDDLPYLPSVLYWKKNTNDLWKLLFCSYDDGSALNQGSAGSCRYDINTNNTNNEQLCEDSQACNYDQLLDGGSCEYPPENYNCTGSWVGDYCGAASVCNTGSRATCTYPDSDRVACDGNPLYCEDSQACNYDQLLDGGSCEYPPENYNCTGSWTGEICEDSQATNYGSAGSCQFAVPPQGRICDNSQATNYGSAGSCLYENNNGQLNNTNNANNVASEYGTGTTNGTQSYDTGDETGNNPNIATTSSDIGSVFNNMNVLNNNSNNNNVTIDENGNTVTMTQEQLQALIDKVSDLNTSFQNYTSGEFQVNDRYYTTTGELLSYNSPDAPQVQLIPGKDIIDQYEVKYEESQQPNMTYDNETHIPFNYYYKQNTDPNVAYPYDTNEVPIKKPETKYPFFENRFDRPTNFDGKSHTYMHPQNWRYPEHKAPKCKKQKEPNEPLDLDKNYISLNNWDSQIGTILPGFTYKENKY